MFIIQNITSLYNMQPNKQMDIIAIWKTARDCKILDGIEEEMKELIIHE